MEALFEILFEVLFEGCFEIISNDRIDKVLRIVILFFVTTFYLSLIVGFVMIAIKSTVIMKVVMGIISLGILIVLGRLWARLYRHRFL